jgi:hypothetical protein
LLIPVARIGTVFVRLDSQNSNPGAIGKYPLGSHRERPGRAEAQEESSNALHYPRARSRHQTLAHSS